MAGIEKQSQVKKPQNILGNNTKGKEMLVASLEQVLGKNKNKTTVGWGSTEHTFGKGKDTTAFGTTGITVQRGKNFSASAGMTSLLAANDKGKLEREDGFGVTLRGTF